MITLSPFEVNTSQDYGYQAQNTLSGSRLNTSLKDTAAPISVFTKDFLADIGATTLGNVAKWAVGTKIYHNEDEGNQNDLLFNPTIIKVRGQLSSTGRNYYEWVLSVDNFNTERLELSSGPNSILFGIGSPGGIFNSQTKRAETGALSPRCPCGPTRSARCAPLSTSTRWSSATSWRFASIT